MTDTAQTHSSAEIVESGAMCSIEELCRACNVDAEWIVELVAYGIIAPVGLAKSNWQFASAEIVRVAKAKRLESEFVLGPSGLAVVLDLLDEINDLRTQLRMIDRAATSIDRQ